MESSKSLNAYILRCKQVLDKTGLSRSTLYAQIKAGRFPKQIQLTSGRCVGWLEEEVDVYIKDRIIESRSVLKGGN